MFLDSGEIVIGDDTPMEVSYPKEFGRGLIPRDFGAYPEGFLSPPAQIELIPESEWSERARDKEVQKSRLSDIRDRIPSLNQGNVGYCWAHSTAHCVILDRQVKNQPYIPLSAYAVAAIIKGGRDEGGWCGLSAKWMTDIGIPIQQLWPQGNRSLSLDTPQMRLNAGLHRITAGWSDFSRALWDQKLSFGQTVTLLHTNVPCALDYNHMSHSVCGVDAVDGVSQIKYSRAASGKLCNLIEFEKMWGINDPVTGGIGIRFWNSWGDSWSQRGMGILTGQKAIPNGAIAVTSTVPSVA